MFNADSLSSTPAVPVYPTRADMTFATNCLRASGIIRKQLVQLDSVMHPSALPPPQQSTSSSTIAEQQQQRPTNVATTSRCMSFQWPINELSALKPMAPLCRIPKIS